MPEFAYPWILLLLIPVLALAIWRLRRPLPALSVSSVSLFNPNQRRLPLRFRVPFLLETLALIAFIFALARPQSLVEVVPTEREGIDIMLSLDFSNSMDIYDPGPEVGDDEAIEAIEAGELVDRLAVARTQIRRFVERRSGDRIGLVIFGIEGWTVSPPTLDHDYLLALLNQLENSILSPGERGTNIAAGIATAVDSLPESEEKRRCIILITDGAHQVQDPNFTPVSAAELAAERGIPVHTIGIGGEDPFAYQNTMLKNAGGTEFETETIEMIAETTGGRFFRVRDESGFENVMDTIDRLETTTRIHPSVVYKSDLFPVPLLLGAISLGSAFFLGRTFFHLIS